MTHHVVYHAVVGIAGAVFVVFHAAVGSTDWLSALGIALGAWLISSAVHGWQVGRLKRDLSGAARHAMEATVLARAGLVVAERHDVLDEVKEEADRVEDLVAERAAYAREDPIAAEVLWGSDD